MSTTIKLTIIGEPMGKQRPKATTISGRVRTYTPKETVNYESQVVNSYNEFLKKEELPIETIYFGHGTEIWATIVAYFKIPKNHYRYHKRTNKVELDTEGSCMKHGKIRPIKKPDCDNIAKICLDALNGIAYPDDSQITSLMVLKYYDEQPRVEITLERRGL